MENYLNCLVPGVGNSVFGLEHLRRLLHTPAASGMAIMGWSDYSNNGSRLQGLDFQWIWGVSRMVFNDQCLGEHSFTSIYPRGQITTCPPQFKERGQRFHILMRRVTCIKIAIKVFVESILCVRQQAFLGETEMDEAHSLSSKSSRFIKKQKQFGLQGPTWIHLWHHSNSYFDFSTEIVNELMKQSRDYRNRPKTIWNFDKWW